MKKHKGIDVFLFETQTQWLTWLKSNHKQHEAVWLKYAKKGSEFRSISYEQSREGAIIYGWIDGLINRLDQDWYLRRFSPRRPRSIWSQINRGIAEELIQSKRMKPSGLAEVEAARMNGQWDAAYSSGSKIQIPNILVARLKANKKARLFFDTLNRTERYSILFRLETSKKAETQQRWLDRIMKMLESEQKVLPAIRKKK